MTKKVQACLSSAERVFQEYAVKFIRDNAGLRKATECSDSEVESSEPSPYTASHSVQSIPLESM